MFIRIILEACHIHLAIKHTSFNLQKCLNEFLELFVIIIRNSHLILCDMYLKILHSYVTSNVIWMHVIVIKTYECFIVYQYKLQLVHINSEQERRKTEKTYFKSKWYVSIENINRSKTHKVLILKTYGKNLQLSFILLFTNHILKF